VVNWQAERCRGIRGGRSSYAAGNGQQVQRVAEPVCCTSRRQEGGAGRQVICRENPSRQAGAAAAGVEFQVWWTLQVASHQRCYAGRSRTVHSSRTPSPRV